MCKVWVLLGIGACVFHVFFLEKKCVSSVLVIHSLVEMENIMLNSFQTLGSKERRINCIEEVPPFVYIRRNEFEMILCFYL